MKDSVLETTDCYTFLMDTIIHGLGIITTPFLLVKIAEHSQLTRVITNQEDLPGYRTVRNHIERRSIKKVFCSEKGNSKVI
jgi:hypothetical protein